MSPGAAGPQERDTIRDLIRPSLIAAGWQDDQIIREYYLQARRVVSFGGASRAVGRGFADLVLQPTPGTPVAVIEAKREYRTAEDAIQQAIRYAIQVDAPLAYGSKRFGDHREEPSNRA